MYNKKLQSLLEELKGEVAKTDNDATKEEAPEVYTVKLSNDEVFPTEDHEEKEEVKELIIEDKLYSEEELKALFEELDLDTDKYTFSYLAEELGFDLLEDEVTSKGEVAMTDNEATKEVEGEKVKPTENNDIIFPAKDHKEVEEIEEVIVEDVTSKGEVAVTDNEATKEVEGTTAKPTDTNTNTFPTDEHEEKEEIEGIVVEEYTRDEIEAVFEALNLDTDKYTFDYLAEEFGFYVLDEDITSKGEVAVTGNEATKETEGTLLTPTKDNKDTFGTDEHEQKEEIEEVIVEAADLLELFNELELNLDKFNFDYLAEQFGFVAISDEEQLNEGFKEYMGHRSNRKVAGKVAYDKAILKKGGSKETAKLAKSKARTKTNLARNKTLAATKGDRSRQLDADKATAKTNKDNRKFGRRQNKNNKAQFGINKTARSNQRKDTNATRKHQSKMVTAGNKQNKVDKRGYKQTITGSKNKAGFNKKVAKLQNKPGGSSTGTRVSTGNVQNALSRP